MRVHALAPVVAIDLDGTSGDYHGHFTWFVNNVYFPGGYPASQEWANQIVPRWASSLGPIEEFSTALGMDKTHYRQAKLAYRQGGLKRCMPIFEIDHKAGGLQPAIEYIRSQGVQVWVTTNRPWMRLDNIDPDTKFWIDKNMGEVDGVIFSQEKYHDLIDHVGKDRILGVFDDLTENIEEANRLGLNMAIRPGDHNRRWIQTGRPPRDMRIMHSFATFTHLVDEWLQEYNNKQPSRLGAICDSCGKPLRGICDICDNDE